MEDSFVGGCSGTRFGCCPNSNRSKIDKYGSNCHSNRHHRHHRPYIYNPINIPYYREVIKQPVVIRKEEKVYSNESLYIFIILSMIVLFIIFFIIRFLK